MTTGTMTLSRCHRGTVATTGTTETPEIDGMVATEEGKRPESLVTTEIAGTRRTPETAGQRPARAESPWSGVTASGNERGNGRRRERRTESEKRRGKGTGLRLTGRRNPTRTTGVTGEVTDVKMEGERKEGRTTGQIGLRGTDEGEGVPTKYPIKARTDITNNT